MKKHDNSQNGRLAVKLEGVQGRSQFFQDIICPIPPSFFSRQRLRLGSAAGPCPDEAAGGPVMS